MDKKTESKSRFRQPNRMAVIAVVILLIVVVFVLLITQMTSPRRSVAAYCQTYKEEKVRLEKLAGNTWPSGVFNDQVGDAGEFASSFGKLERVAPEEIRGDVVALKSVYQKMHDDPSQAMSASLSGASADSNLKSWTNQNCKAE